jgi:hypothetical protein
MTPQISKEAMEKAKEITKTAHVHVASQDDRDRCAKCGENFRSHLSVNETLESRIALEFTNYQKRIEELEEIVKEAARLSPARSDMRPDHQMQILRDKAKDCCCPEIDKED